MNKRERKKSQKEDKGTDDQLFVVPIETVVFESDKRFSDLSSPESDAAWGSMMPVSFPIGLFQIHSLTSYGGKPSQGTVS